MRSRRLKLIRGRRTAIQEQRGPTTFGDVRMGESFYLTPKGTTRVSWIKVSKWGAQYEDWSNDSDLLDQEFPKDYPVYIQ